MGQTVWDRKKIADLFIKPFFELINQAYNCHKAHFPVAEMQCCALASIKTGACPEDCAYCPQSGHYKTGLKKEKLFDLKTVLTWAKQAKANGATRFCMGAAWKDPPKKAFPHVIAMIKAIKEIGLETCATLGMLNEDQAIALKDAGLDFYNHNIDTSPEYYPKIITTRTYQDRIDTLTHVANAQIKTCCGGIIGMGESREDRVNFLLALYKLPSVPQSIPINHLIPIPGTPLEKCPKLDPFEFIRTIAISRLMFPTTKIRLSAGRENMSDEMQAWCFMAGANSIFIGDRLLTAKNPEKDKDMLLLKKLDITVEEKA